MEWEGGDYEKNQYLEVLIWARALFISLLASQKGDKLGSLSK